MSTAAIRPTGARILCLGFDPMPRSGLQKDWLDCFDNHLEFFELLDRKPQWVKLNLAFFLRWGRLGIDKLELACETLGDKTNILLDGKFGEIGNSLSHYLDFAFEHLKADGVTVNPFMGEHIIGSALQKALSLRGASSRVFVLGATSEFPQKKLAELQNSYSAIAEACEDAHLTLDPSGSLGAHLGLVVGANRQDAMTNEVILRGQMPLLMPGIGAQGVSLESAVKRTAPLAQEIIFPVSRAICEGGNLKPIEMQHKFQQMQNELDSLLSQPRGHS
ncbi:MAG: hypothetical protein RLZZ488_2737 [Pseudomonadota bacterium]|jgi:orotidine-5'-phosphate decarboxylase